MGLGYPERLLRLTCHRRHSALSEQRRPGARLDVALQARHQHAPTSWLVSERRDGTRRLYRAESAGLVGLKQFVDRFWDTGLDRLKEEAEAEASRRART
jgi:hypothetical protein